MSRSHTLIVDQTIAFLVDNACKLDKQAKEIKDHLTGIKVELEVLEPGKYRTESGNTVTISQSPKFTEINPADAKGALREKRLGRNFLKCVKVNTTNLKRFLSDQEIGSLRTIQSYTRKHSFK